MREEVVGSNVWEGSAVPRSQQGISPDDVLGMGKRARSENPFSKEAVETVQPSDPLLFTEACGSAVTLARDDVDVVQLLGQIPVNDMDDFLQVLQFGKQQHDIKVKMLIALIPRLKSMLKAKTKLAGSYDVISDRLASKIWRMVVEQSATQKFNSDVLKMMLTQLANNM